MSSIVNKIKEVVHSDKSHSDTTHAHKEGEHGPHGNRAANAADPRIDSDRDHRAAPGTTAGLGHTTHATHGTGATGMGTNVGTSAYTTGTGDNLHSGTGVQQGFAPGPASNTAGPHKSDALNKADPRIDSDMDGSRNMGATSHQQTYAPHSTSAGAGLGRQHEHQPGVGAGGLTGTGAGSGVTGYDDPTGTHGPHGNRAMNAVDPRIDSDRDHRAAPHHHAGAGAGAGAFGAAAAGPGPASNTAGPHKSDALNKADPRVDSDLDGSKTYGGNKTLAGATTTTTAGGRDPLDAAQVPPSVLRRHVGEPSIAHEDHGHNRDRRNSAATHQENFRGI